MKIVTKLATPIAVATALLIFCCLMIETARATGISIDAGLTPAQNRWVLRSQVRYMQRDNGPPGAMSEMRTYMVPFVLAHGLRSDLTIMLRQIVADKRMTMMDRSSSKSGLTDLMLMAKYRLARINTPTYTLGIAATLGLEMPTGAKYFTSDSWDMRSGLFLSGRSGYWGMDLNIAYFWDGMIATNDTDLNPGDELSILGAISRRFGFGSQADKALEPLVEGSYQKIWANALDNNTVPNTGESVFVLSPGIKFTWLSYVLEGLVQIPIWQNQKGLQTERAVGFLVGIRIMN
ncbi:MAG: transporter [Candidatus Zixiibacteriota bacterium]